MKNTTIIGLLIGIVFGNCQSRKTTVSNDILDSCQHLNQLIQTKGADTAALTHDLSKAFTLSDSHSNQEHDSLISLVCRLKGLSLLGEDKYTEARFYFEKGLRVGLRHLLITADIIVKHYSNIAVTYYNSDAYKDALRYYDSVQIIRDDEISLSIKTDNLCQAAICYRELKDLVSSEKMIGQACLTAEPFYSKPDLAWLYIRYATILRAGKKYQTSIDKAQKAITILESLIKNKAATKRDSSTLANGYFYTAYALTDSGQYAQAIPFHIKAIKLYKEVGNFSNHINGLMNLGNTYRLNKDYDKGEQAIRGALNLLNQSPDLSDLLKVRKGELFVGLDEIFMDKKAFDKALIVQDSAINYLTRYEASANLNNLLLTHRHNLLAVYKDKAISHLKQAENGSDTEGYQKSLKLTQQIIELADDIRADYFSDDAKLTLANDIKPALERAIEVCQKLYAQTNDKQYLQQAFGFVEYSRGMVLYENARLENQLKPHLKAENAALKQQEAALIANNNIEALQNYLRLKRQFREKIKILNRNELAAVADLQTALIKDDKTAFIEYFVGDSTIFTFILLQNDVKLTAIKTPRDLSQQVQNLRNEIIKHKPIVDDARVFIQQANTLYAILLDKTLAQVPTTIHQLIVAPDGVLNYLPFDILIKGDPSVFLLNDKSGFEMSDVGKSKNVKDAKKASKNSSFIVHPSSLNFQDCAFLLRQYTISYAYSANLLLAQKRVKKAHNQALFAGFTAKYEENDPRLLEAVEPEIDTTRGSSSDLKWAREEVKTISTLLGGDAFINEKATETTFKRVANRYRILHFAMHGLVDNEDPALNKLLFTLTPKDTMNDNNLTAAELQTMPLNADLAVLSACNTGFGVLRKGEGVMSVARAFSYAGVPATVTSLWSAPDRETSEIMVAFYKNLEKGLSKDAALRQAKLTYLDNSTLSKEANPFFWAAFIPIGNMEAMDLEKKHPLSIWGILAGLGLVSGLGFWFWKRKRGK